MLIFTQTPAHKRMGLFCLCSFLYFLYIIFFLVDLSGSENGLFSNREFSRMWNDCYENEWKVVIISFPLLLCCSYSVLFFVEWHFVYLCISSENIIHEITKANDNGSGSTEHSGQSMLSFGFWLIKLILPSCISTVLRNVKKEKNQGSSEHRDFNVSMYQGICLNMI